MWTSYISSLPSTTTPLTRRFYFNFCINLCFENIWFPHTWSQTTTRYETSERGVSSGPCCHIFEQDTSVGWGLNLLVFTVKYSRSPLSICIIGNFSWLDLGDLVEINPVLFSLRSGLSRERHSRRGCILKQRVLEWTIDNRLRVWSRRQWERTRVRQHQCGQGRTLGESNEDLYPLYKVGDTETEVRPKRTLSKRDIVTYRTREWSTVRHGFTVQESLRGLWRDRFYGHTRGWVEMERIKNNIGYNHVL